VIQAPAEPQETAMPMCKLIARVARFDASQLMGLPHATATVRAELAIG
jgi:hypothetical protein